MCWGDEIPPPATSSNTEAPIDPEEGDRRSGGA
jgi:hypothetical protein